MWTFVATGNVYWDVRNKFRNTAPSLEKHSSSNGINHLISSEFLTLLRKRIFQLLEDPSSAVPDGGHFLMVLHEYFSPDAVGADDKSGEQEFLKSLPP